MAHSCEQTIIKKMSSRSQDSLPDSSQAMSQTAASDTLVLPPKPQEPLPTDCCGTGCKPCVFDIYEQEVELWESECEKMLRGNCLETENERVLSPIRYEKFEILKVEKETTDSFCYTFTISNQQRLPLKIGQHLVLRCFNGEKPVTRQYTPISDPRLRGKFSLVIKLYEGGEMSECIRRWQAGDKVDCRGPFGDFSYTPNAKPRLLLLAAGTGLAPMIQVIHHVLHNETDDTRVRLLYACKTYRDILCKSVLDEFSSYWNFSVLYILSKESADGLLKKRYGDEVIRGRIDEALLNTELGSDDTGSTRVLICGTKSFDKDMINFLRRRGLPEERYFRF